MPGYKVGEAPNSRPGLKPRAGRAPGWRSGVSAEAGIAAIRRLQGRRAARRDRAADRLAGGSRGVLKGLAAELGEGLAAEGQLLRALLHPRLLSDRSGRARLAEAGVAVPRRRGTARRDRAADRSAGRSGGGLQRLAPQLSEGLPAQAHFLRAFPHPLLLSDRSGHTRR